MHDAAATAAVVAQFTLPAVPFVHYGKEIGMDGGHDPDCRHPMIWDENRWDKETLAFYKKIIGIRQSQVVNMEAGNLRLDIPPRSAAIFVPDDTRLKNDKFFKPWNLAG
jgi:glycosidase